MVLYTWIIKWIIKLATEKRLIITIIFIQHHSVTTIRPSNADMEH